MPHFLSVQSSYSVSLPPHTLQLLAVVPVPVMKQTIAVMATAAAEDRLFPGVVRRGRE